MLPTHVSMATGKQYPPDFEDVQFKTDILKKFLSPALPYPKRQKWDGLGSLADYPPNMKNLGHLSAACSPSTERTSC